MADGQWSPCSRPQQLFLAAPEFEVFYGGAKGGGKSEVAVVLPLQQITHPEFRCLLLRERWDELKYLQQRCKNLYPALGATYHGGNNQWTFPSGAFVEIGYYAGEQDINRYQGRGWSAIIYDELGNLSEERAWELLIAEIRTPHKDLVLMARGTGNPGGKGHGWLKRRFIVPTNNGETVYETPSGTLRRFIPARLSDNIYLMRDRRYVSQLETLPEVRREMLLHGNWDAADGLALTELSRDKHFCPPFPHDETGKYAIPDHWLKFGGFDWGFIHPWCFTWLAVSPTGVTYVVNTIHGHKQNPKEIADRIRESVPIHTLSYIHAGRDTFDELRARGESTPSIAEHFMTAGIRCDRANISRKFGLNNMREYLKWRGLENKDPMTPEFPRLRICKTPGNAKLFDCLETMVIDPDDVEDALKLDAVDSEGGDDPYDALRYALASRPITPADKKHRMPENRDRDEVELDDLLADAMESGSRPKTAPYVGRLRGWQDQIPE